LTAKKTPALSASSVKAACTIRIKMNLVILVYPSG
jgi:hypothetical protein